MARSFRLLGKGGWDGPGLTSLKTSSSFHRSNGSESKPELSRKVIRLFLPLSLTSDCGLVPTNDEDLGGILMVSLDSRLVFTSTTCALAGARAVAQAYELSPPSQMLLVSLSHPSMSCSSGMFSARSCGKDSTLGPFHLFNGLLSHAPSLANRESHNSPGSPRHLKDRSEFRNSRFLLNDDGPSGSGLSSRSASPSSFDFVYLWIMGGSSKESP